MHSLFLTISLSIEFDQIFNKLSPGANHLKNALFWLDISTYYELLMSEWVIKWLMSCCVMFESDSWLAKGPMNEAFLSFWRGKRKCLQTNFKKKKEKHLKPYSKPMSFSLKHQECSEVKQIEVRNPNLGSQIHKRKNFWAR